MIVDGRGHDAGMVSNTTRLQIAEGSPHPLEVVGRPNSMPCADV